MKNTGNVPKLRFPEFRDARAWGKRKLGEFITQRNQSSNEKFPLFSLTIEDGITPKTERYERSFLLKDSENSYKVVLQNDFAYNPMNLRFGAIGRYAGKEPVALSKYYNVFCCDKSINSRFLEFYLRSYRMIIFYNKMAIGSLIEKTRVHFSTFINFKIPLPSLLEQQKIADCLSSLDDLITAETQKLDSLKVHKKGLMQQLFPAEGETIPQLRFPEFRNAGAWEEKLLGEVINYENGKAHENHISDNRKYIVVNSKFISTEGEVRKYTDEAFCIAQKQDILMVLSDVPNGRAIAKCYFVEADHLYTVNQRICKIKPKKCIGKFLFYILDRNSFFLAFDDGVKQTNLRKEDVLSCPVFAPSLSEQQKIADCLSSLDDLITTQTQKIEALKLHKKGLMQQLFPAVE